MKGSLFSIGIDLGTTNSAMAYTRLTDDQSISETFRPAQWESLTSIGQATTLPSFLFLPTEAEALEAGLDREASRWMVGIFARRQSAETPGRVVHSAKSWLCHHAVDRSAQFLPWASDVLAESEKISPLHASALILATLKASWDQRFADLGPQGAFTAQQVTLTVPASFDAAAQKLTLDAAQMAGFPDDVRLIEEPQAAFYRWLEFQMAGSRFSQVLPVGGGGGKDVLVVDIGGGTTDFSLFHVTAEGENPKIERTAVSDHILLGGDNVDLALAYMVRARLEGQGHEIGGSQWPFLVARCRDLKERVLATEGEQEETFTLAVPGRGSGLLASTLTGRLSRRDVLAMMLDGFFPLCQGDEEPERSDVALKEWGLPYASDSGVTRYLAQFLRDRPRTDAVLFNGGALYPEILRQRLSHLIASWQEGHQPVVLENTEPDLSVARGAARYGWLRSREQLQIEAGAARSLYLEAQRAGAEKGASVVCILPRGTELEEDATVELDGLRLRVDQPVRFQAFYTTKRGRDKAGDTLSLEKGGFHSLPPLQTVARLSEGMAKPERGQIPVRLRTRINALGLLQVSCESLLEDLQASWPLDFNLRAVTVGSADASAESGPAVDGDPGVGDAQLEAGLALLRRRFRPVSGTQPGRKSRKKMGVKEKVTPARVFRSLEEVLALPKQDWNWMLVRSLWPALQESESGRRRSVEHEETWLSLVGYMLRPGYGAHLDDARLESLWYILQGGLAFPNRRIKLQEYILWRRLSGGLSRERQEQLIGREWKGIAQSKNPPAELIRMAGAFERLPQDKKRELITLFLERATDNLDAGKAAGAYLVALTLLLNRAPLYAGPEAVVPPEWVERAYDRLRAFDWEDERHRETLPLFLRAARVVDNPYLDVTKPIRKKIATQLERAGLAPVKVVPVRDYAPLEKADRAGLLGESLPAGIVID